MLTVLSALHELAYLILTTRGPRSSKRQWDVPAWTSGLLPDMCHCSGPSGEGDGCEGGLAWPGREMGFPGLEPGPEQEC